MGYDPVGRISDPLEPVRQELDRIHGLVREASIPEGTRVAQVVRRIGAQVREIEDVAELNTISFNELAAQDSMSVSIPDRSFAIAANASVNWSNGFSFTPEYSGVRDALLSGRVFAPNSGGTFTDYDQRILFLSDGSRFLVTPQWFALSSAATSAPDGFITFAIPLRLEGGVEHQFQIAGKISSFGPGTQTIRLEDMVFSLRIFSEV